VNFTIKILIIVLIFSKVESNSYSQTGKYEFNDCNEATQMLYSEINKYRAKFGLIQLSVSEKLEEKALSWNKYMVEHYIDLHNNAYKHANMGPKEYHNQDAEIIHMVYFNHQPSPYEMTVALMYGWLANKDRGKIKGWVDSPGHDENLKLKNTVLMGASVALFKTESWWVVTGVVKFTN
jgi:uncharacterized protein YkwD